jgi:hypothetical protein
MNKTLLFLFCTAFLASSALAGEIKVITLKDGSRMKGEVTGMTDGTYTVRTAFMGDVRLNDKNIASIVDDPTALPAAVPTPQGIAATPEYRDLQSKIMSDQSAMADIQALLQDPEVAEIIKNPEFMAAVQSGDPNAIQSNPLFKRLAENPKMKLLGEKIQAQFKPAQ